MPINHKKVSGKSDGADATQVQPSNWNDVHVIGDMLTNANAGTIAAGSPVYCSAAGSMDLAKADAAATADCVGLVPADVLHAALGLAQELDSITLTTGQWDARTGQVGGLTAGARYYVDPATAGKLTPTAPSAAGQFVTAVGRALSTTIMRLRLESPIGL